MAGVRWRSATLAALGGLALLPAAASAAPGPALEVTDAEVDSALSCTPDLKGASHDPVLLTPAFSTAAASYGWNYLARLPKIGIPTCSITVPDSGYGDLQRTAEYVVAAVRRMSRESGRDVILLGHQHGALDELWALTYWPDVARKASDLISLATPYNGTTAPLALCGNGAPCAAATRQITTGSAFIGAFAAARVPGKPNLAFTSIATNDDTLITPQPDASRFRGGVNVQVQDLCPGRQVSHFDILADAVAYELVLDAMEHEGPADPARIDPPCGTKLMPDADPALATAANGFLPIFLAQNTAAAVPAEPEVRGYAERRAPVLSISKRARRSRDRVAFRVRCESVSRTACTAKLRVRVRGAVVDRRRLTLRPGGPKVVRASVPRGTRRAAVELRAVDALGNRGSRRGLVRVRG